MAGNEIRFLLDDEEVRLETPAPTLTVLEWLREARGRTGTKEGCAEGDCGACTVVLAEAHRGALRWRAVNACLLFLPCVHGQALYTVESLRRRGSAPHPAQQAMVDCHASQCGFCTPGFVMSLFALYQSRQAPDDEEIADALAGNLCRCTGYRPIVDAARHMYTLARPEAESAVAPPLWDDTRQGESTRLLRRLAALDDGADLDLRDTHGRRFVAPRTLARLAAHYAEHPQAALLGGGTDLALRVTKALDELPHLVHLGMVDELRDLTEADGWLEIGAAASLEDAFLALERHYPEIGELHRRFASRPIRGAGTLGGNIATASPIGDSMPALMALGAELILRHGDRCRRLPLDAFYLGYRRTVQVAGELIAAIRVPLRPPAGRFHFRVYKVSRRFDQDISAVAAGFALHLEGGTVTRARLAFGGMAAVPQGAARAEATLVGRAFDGAALAAAREALAQDLTPLSDLRASAGYRLAVAQNLLTRFHLEWAGGPITRVVDGGCLDEAH